MLSISESRLRIYHLLFSEPICSYGIARADGILEQNVLILGDNSLALEAAKAVFWAGQFVDSKLHITLAAQQADNIREKFFPAKGNSDYPDLRRFVDKGYADFSFYTFSSKPWEEMEALLSMCPYGYIIVCDNTENIITPLQRTILAMEYHDYPMLLAVCTEQFSLFKGSNKLKVVALGEEKNDNLLRMGRNINFAYDMKYDQRTTDRSSFERFDSAYTSEFCDANSEAAFLGSNYTADSSLSSAVHIPYKSFACSYLYQGVNIANTELLQHVIANRNTDRKCKDTYHKLLAMEHRRWNAFMVFRGFRSPTQEEEKKYLYKNGNNHQDRSRRLHLCMCDCAEDGPQLEHSFYKKYQSWQLANSPNQYPSELDRASLRAHELAATASQSVSADIESLLSELDDESVFCKNFKYSIRKLVNDEANSLALYRFSLQQLKQHSSDEIIAVATQIDRALLPVIAWVGRMDFLSLDAQLLDMLPFCLWYGKQYQSVVTITQMNPIDDVIIPTLLCAKDAVFLGKNIESNKSYQTRILNYFSARGSTTTPHFINLSIDRIQDVQKGLQQYIVSNQYVIASPVHASGLVSLAIGSILADPSRQAPVIGYSSATGICAFSGEKDFVGLNNKSFSAKEYIGLIGGEINNEYSLLYDMKECQKLQYLFEQHCVRRKCVKYDEQGKEKVVYYNTWGQMATFFQSNETDGKVGICANKAEDEDSLDLSNFPIGITRFSGMFSREIFEVCELDTFLSELEKYRIIGAYAATSDNSVVSVSFDYCEEKLVTLLSPFLLQNCTEETIHKRLQFYPASGVRRTDLQFREKVLYQSTQHPDEIKHKKRYLIDMHNLGFITLDGFSGIKLGKDATSLDSIPQKVSFVFRDPITMWTFKQQGSVFELVVYKRMKESGVFDDIETGMQISWDAERSDYLNHLEAQLQTTNRIGYSVYLQARKAAKQLSFTDTESTPENELDVVAFSGMEPFFISCKTNNKNQIGWIYEISSLANTFGAKPVLAVAQLDGAGGAFVARAKHTKVSLLGTDILQNAKSFDCAMQTITDGNVVNVSLE